MHDRRQRHQNRFGAASRLQAEQGAAVEYEIEFDVAPAPVRLKVALAVAVWRIASTLDDRYVRIQKRIADGALHGEALSKTGLMKVIEEHAADAARLVAMLQIEIFVAPLLEARVFVGAEGFERALARRVEVMRVLLVSVVRRQIRSAAEPKDVTLILRLCDEETTFMCTVGTCGLRG